MANYTQGGGGSQWEDLRLLTHDVTREDVREVCGWLRSFLLRTEGVVIELSMWYIEGLHLQDVGAMVLKDKSH